MKFRFPVIIIDEDFRSENISIMPRGELLQAAESGR